MNKLRWGICTLALALGGCMHAAKPDLVRHYTLDHYTLGDDTTTAAGQDRSAVASHAILYIAPIDVPPWLDSEQMFYRLGYRHDASLSAYAHSDWSAPPAALLADVVRRALAASGTWRAVVGPGTPVRADASLHIRLDDFSQDFAQPDHSSGVISATATLVDSREGSVIGQRDFEVRVAARSADARGGAMALGQASRELAAKLGGWLRRLARSHPVEP